VVSTKDFGAFIEIAPGTDGMCHISELADGYVKSVDDVVKIGDVVKVKVINVDDTGRIKLSRRAAMEGEEGGEDGADAGDDGDREDRSDDRGEGSDDRKGKRRRGGRGRGRKKESVGAGDGGDHD
jgi:polyribonucleotide nucleotidyltransferase